MQTETERNFPSVGSLLQMYATARAGPGLNPALPQRSWGKEYLNHHLISLRLHRRKAGIGNRTRTKCRHSVREYGHSKWHVS